MNIKINGQPETLSLTTLSIAELLKHKNVEMPEMVSVEYNGDILDRSAFETTKVNDGDDIEFLYFMGGGSF
jgi:sulfur carrier protein